MIKKVFRDAWTILTPIITEFFKQPKDVIGFYTQFVIFFVIILTPIYIFRTQDAATFTAAYLAGIMHTIALQQHSNIIIGKIATGEYEAFLLTSVSNFSLYITNLGTVILMFPVLFCLYLLTVFISKSASPNLGIFILSILLLLLSNAGFSLFLGGLHLAYRSMRWINGILGVISTVYCMIAVPVLYHSRFKEIVMLVPWTHSTLLIIHSFTPILLPKQIIISIIYLCSIGAFTIPLALKFLKTAEKRAKKRGFVSDIAPI